MLRLRVSQLQDALSDGGDALEAECRLALIAGRIREHLRAVDRTSSPRQDVASQLRELMDSRVREGLTLREAGALLDAHPDHLVRAFTAAFGLPPHRYLTARRIDLARRELLAGARPADVAVAVGFHDQSHLSRHFSKQVGVPPARYAHQRLGARR